MRADKDMLNELAMEEGLTDCYMWKGKLIVQNEYDKDLAEQWFAVKGYLVSVVEADADMDSLICYG
jgi:hypothetical protein